MTWNGSVTNLTTETKMQTGKTPGMPYKEECRRQAAVILQTLHIKMTDNPKGTGKYHTVPFSYYPYLLFLLRSDIYGKCLPCLFKIITELSALLREFHCIRCQIKFCGIITQVSVINGGNIHSTHAVTPPGKCKLPAFPQSSVPLKTRS